MSVCKVSIIKLGLELDMSLMDQHKLSVLVLLCEL